MIITGQEVVKYDFLAFCRPDVQASATGADLKGAEISGN